MVVVVASFTANLASLLTVESFSSVVSNLADLRRKALPFVVNTGGATFTYFTRSMDPSILLMQAKMQVSGRLQTSLWCGLPHLCLLNLVILWGSK